MIRRVASIAEACATHARTGGGSLYQLSPDGAVRIVLDGLTVPNGLHWSARGDQVYFVDSATNRIDVFDFDPATGSLLEGRPFVRIDTASGVPDGMAIDDEGGLWVALYGGGAVHRYGSDGSMDERIEVPGASNVTACCFGGPDLRTLFITTSREGLAETDEPAAGALFAVQPGVRGSILPAFAG